MKKLLQLLFTQYQKDVYGYLFSLCHDAALAEELTADTFLAVVQSFPRFRGESDEKTWLFSIARHRWYAYLRQQKRHPTAAWPEDLLTACGTSPEDLSCTHETAARIQALLQQEPERTQAIVQLRLEGLSFREIGQKLGISENSARVIDFRAKAKIKDILQKEGFTDE